MPSYSALGERASNKIIRQNARAHYGLASQSALDAAEGVVRAQFQLSQLLSLVVRVNQGFGRSLDAQALDGLVRSPVATLTSSANTRARRCGFCKQ